ncbi:hypothetical protein MKW98_008177 [Papaver atlanticum]|uniref:Trichome birefringence-like N-terminal domain-containing protein n=1 Tax=Papaver atlanticum TaxID=357466 RepID=A0AAD4RVZ3_9MAGN|nr:hypothetical protein MKW98_008177 [Papaver atlanticum]
MALLIRGYHKASLLLVVSYYFLVLNHICAEQISSAGRCDLYQGSWVYDESYPLYDSSKCPWVSESFLCVPNGRPDKDYLKYRWSPSGCHAPRFDALDFLRRYTGKKIMFVGDSISNNQWQSLTCMIHAAIPNAKYSGHLEQNTVFINFTDYNVSLLYNRNVYLVDLVAENSERVLKIDTISTGDVWKEVDAVIFNTWHWWWLTGSLQGGNDWGSPGTNCANHTAPIYGTVYPGSPIPGVAVVKQVLSRMSVHVNLLDITTLSRLRIDGHPSRYASKGGTAHDCGHWCLAGVPDTWNSLFYASVVLSESA